MEMKLSDILIDYATFWFLETADSNNNYWNQQAMVHMLQTHENYHSIQSENALSFLCLLEAEYQKDIEANKAEERMFELEV